MRQIERLANAHALEAFAIGTALYLALGVVIGVALDASRPREEISKGESRVRTLIWR